MWRPDRSRITISVVVVSAIATIIAPCLSWAAGPWLAGTSVERLARQIDKLERHIDTYGTVVAKTPDVWGEARLTKYRQEFEKVLEKEKDTFKPTINAAISRSDQAFLANSFALQAAVNGRAATVTQPSTASTKVTESLYVRDSQGKLLLGPDNKPISAGTSETTGLHPDEDEVVRLAVPPPATNTVDAAFERTKLLRQDGRALQGFGSEAVALEPTIKLDQMARYLNHLHELRRINDGDDKADFPGYSLNLVRIPISVLPGKKTREGYGAEVSVIAKPHLHDELLPQTFRHLVVNDVVDVLALPITKLIDAPDAQELLAALEKGELPNPRRIDDLKKQRNDFELQKQDLLSRLDYYQRERDKHRQIEQSSNVQIAAADAKHKELLAERNQVQRDQRAIAPAKESLAKQSIELREQFPIGVNVNEAELKNFLDPATMLPDPKNIFDLEFKLFGPMKPSATDKSQKEPNAPERAVIQSTNPVVAQPAVQKLTKSDATKRLLNLKSQFIQLAEKETALTNRDNELAAEISHQEKLRLSSINKAETAEVNANEFESKINQLLAPVSKEDSDTTKQQKIDGVLRQIETVQRQIDLIERQTLAIKKVTEAMSLFDSLSPGRRARLPFPPSHLLAIYGGRFVADIATLALNAKSDLLHQPHALILDVQKTFLAETDEAYELLTKYSELWQYCSPELARAVRTLDKSSLKVQRQCFVDHAHKLNPSLCDAHEPGLAWAIIVESALLNERLIEDMKHLAAAKNGFHLAEDWMQFFLPQPLPEVRAAFNHYVEGRWPVHVFALDPITQDQNVADSFSQRRELQLAMSIAFASGEVNAQEFMRFARRIELDMETIALNRTVVGFSHGDDTFGWRFYPRVQTPEIESNTVVIFRDLLHGGSTRDHDLGTRRLEPGIRECTAIVIMPSFVPYVVFDLRTNWFSLTKPSKRELDLQQGVELSAEVTKMRQLAQTCVHDQHLYRPDEVYRLTRSVEQLERRLPLQSSFVPMPYENSLGGFEFFNSGIPDLAPELHGFYGEPGIKLGDPTKVSTSLFLVGDNFSVHETKVIIGNKLVESTLLSRQVMSVKIPGDVQPVGDRVDAHVATPYGVSNHILIPVAAALTEAEAIKKAVDEHVDSRHTDKFDWKSDAAVGRIFLKPNRHIDNLYISDTISMLDLSTIPFATKAAELRCFVLEKRKDQNPRRICTTDSVIVNFDKNHAFSSQSLSAGGVEAKVAESLKAANYVVPPDLQELQLVGFLRLNDELAANQAAAPDRSTQPIIKLIRSLKIKVEIIDRGAVPPAPQAARDSDAPPKLPVPPEPQSRSRTDQHRSAAVVATPR